RLPISASRSQSSSNHPHRRLNEHSLGSIPVRERAPVPLRLQAYCADALRRGYMNQCQDIADLRQCAKSRLPRGLFEYVDRGTEDEFAFRAIAYSFRQIRLTPRVLVDVSGCSARTQFFGADSAMPVVVAPTGAAGLLWYDGEVA